MQSPNLAVFAHGIFEGAKDRHTIDWQVHVACDLLPIWEVLADTANAESYRSINLLWSWNPIEGLTDARLRVKRVWCNDVTDNHNLRDSEKLTGLIETAICNQIAIWYCDTVRFAPAK